MTKEGIKEAIDILDKRRECKECVFDCNDGYRCDDCKKAFDLAISALSQPDIEQIRQEMREATPEERQSVDDYIDSISTTVDIEAIRQEIAQEKVGYPPSADEYRTINRVLDIIDKHLQNNCDTCKHHDKSWDELPCDGCCGAHSGYEPQESEEI